MVAPVMLKRVAPVQVLYYLEPWGCWSLLSRVEGPNFFCLWSYRWLDVLCVCVCVCVCVFMSPPAPQCALHIKRSSPMLTPAAACISNYSLCSAGSQGKTGGQVTSSQCSLTWAHANTHRCLNWASEKQVVTGIKNSRGASWLDTYSLIYSSLRPLFDKAGGNIFPPAEVPECPERFRSLKLWVTAVVRGTRWTCSVEVLLLSDQITTDD